MRRAWSSGVSSGVGSCSATPKSLVSLPVETEGPDQGGNRGRNELVDRLSTRNAFSDLAWGDRHRIELEELNLVAARKLTLHGFELFAWMSRTRCDSDACTFEHSFRILPGEELHKLVGADQEEGVLPGPLLQQV